MFSKILFLGTLSISSSLAEHQPGDDPLDWLRESIPGEPGVDYPIFTKAEATSFSCDDKVFGGYYADPEMGCQAYHVCLLDPLGGSMYPTSFICPNGTLFQQQIFNCDWWYNVDCAASEGYYGLAEGAFGSAANGNGGEGGDGGGSCPAANPLSDAECAGTVSNCWSPGQTDTDCPNFGLCCFDGCANTCVDGPKPIQENNNLPETQDYPEYEIPEYVPDPAPSPTPAPVPTSTGYNYPVPDVTLPIRPVTTTTQRPVTLPPTLYGAPPESVPRNGRDQFQTGRNQNQSGRRGRNGRRRGRNGRRLRNGRRRVSRRISQEELVKKYVFV